MTIDDVNKVLISKARAKDLASRAKDLASKAKDLSVSDLA